MATNNATATSNNLLTHNPATSVDIIKVTSLKPFNANTMPKEDQLNGSANILFPHKCEDNSAPHSTSKSITILTTTTTTTTTTPATTTTTTVIINPTSCSTNELSLSTTKTTLLSAVAATAAATAAAAATATAITTTTSLACSSTSTPAITTITTATSTISIATSINTTTTTATTATNLISLNADIKHLPTFLESKTNHHHNNNIINNDKIATTKTITKTTTTTTNSGNETIVKDSLHLSTLYDNRSNGCSNNYKLIRESNNHQQHQQQQQQLQHTFINVQPRKRDVTPTQETSNISFSSASSIQDDISDQCKLTKAGLEEYNIRANSFYDNPMVMYQHQKQSSYAQSEGYHSYVSSSDSTSATPFLDRLRQESELLSRHTYNWSQNDLSSLASNSVNTSPTSHISQHEESHASGQPNGNTVNNNNGNDNGNNGSKNNNNAGSESTSSTETLKWLGSMSDVSETSHATGFSAISESVSTSQLIVHSSRVLTPKRHQSESVLYPSEEVQQQSQQFDKLSMGARNQHHSPQQKQQNTSLQHLHSPSYPPTLTTQPVLHKIPLTGRKEKFNTAEISAHKSNIAITISNSEAVVTVPPQPPAAPATKFAPNSKSALQSPNTNYNTRDASALTRSQVLNSNSCETCSLTKCGANQNLSASLDSLAVDKCVSAASMPTYRSNHRLFPISTYVEPVLSNTSQYVHHPKPQYSSGLQKTPPKPPLPHPTNAVRGNAGGGLSPKFITQSKHSMSSTSNYPLPSWQSVATLINDFERSSDHCQQQHQKYSYLDPNKTQRVPNPALKALQKNAVQSYFDRQLQQQKQTFFEGISPNRYQSGILRPHSLQNSPSASSSGEVMGQQAFLRNSLPGNYVSNVMQNNQISFSENNAMGTKPPSPVPPPPPPRSRSTMPNSHVTLLRRSSSASDYAEFRDQFMTATQEKLQSQSIKNISQTEKLSFNDCGMPPPPPPPRNSRTISTMPMRRTSSASDYAGIRDKMLLQQAAALTHQQLHPNQHGGMPTSSSHHHQTFISNNVQHYHHHHHHHHHNHHHHTQQSFIISGASVPMLAMMGVDNNWAPERPPKNSNLRVPSPDLPPPPALEGDDQNFSDEPLPPPPPEILQRPLLNDAINELPPAKQPISPNRRNSFAGASIRKAHNFFASRSTSTNDDANGGESSAPPLAPRKPNNIEMMPLARSVTASVTQLPKYKQSDIQRATIISSSTRKRPHNLAGISSSFPIIQENALMNAVALKSPSPSQQYDDGTKMKSSSPPPPLMPRMSINGSAGSSSITKTRCNSKASYLPRQNLDKSNQSDPDHGSYKMTLHSNEDVVVGGNSKSSSYDIMATVVSAQQSSAKLPNNLPDVLPLGAKLQPTVTQSNTSVMSGSSTIKQPSPTRYGSSKSLASSHTSPNNTMQRSCTGQQQQQQQQQQQRYSTPLLNAFNLAYPYHRSQSLDTNANNTTTNIIGSNNNPTLMMSSHSPPAKYVAQSLMDLKMKSSLSNLATTMEEQEQHHIGNNNEENSEEDSKSIDSLNTSVKSFHSNTNSTTAESSEARMFRAELVNTTLPNSPYTAKKPLVIRQGSLRENIEKITQLQSQLMSAHMQDNTTTSLLRMDSGGSSPRSADMFIKNKELLHESNKNPSEIDKVRLERENHRGEHEHRSKEESLLLTKPDPEECKGSKEEKNILSQLDSNIDGLKLLQRTELILRVNPSTVEAASQTDDDLTTTDPDSSSEVMKETNEQTSTNPSSPSSSSSLSSAYSSGNHTTLRPRQKHSIELDCVRMMEELAPMLAPNDRLIHLLTPKGSKSIKDYINQLYNPHVHCRPSKRHVGTSTLTRSHKQQQQQQQQQQQPHCNNNELEVMELQLDDMTLNVEHCEILKRKMNDLVTHLQNKARILSKEQITLDEEAAVNDELGQSLINKLTDHIKPLEATKCRTFIADVGHITGLLISLSERLAKTENQLSSLDITNDGDNEKKSLENKRNRLYEQLNEAKRLKEDIDRRGVSVVNVLEKYLSAEEFGDFEYFINMKIKLITDSREIADNIKTGEELLNALSDAFRQSDC